MTDSEIIEVKGIGAVTFVRNPRARRIVISVRPRRGVRVAMPKRASLQDAMYFVRKKEKWIKKHLESITVYEKQKQNFEESFQSIDKEEAKKKINSRLDELARKYGFIYHGVSFRNQRTRWGSCSGKGHLNLNIKLAVLPQELMDYVMLHELVHTRIHNHSKRFWDELDKYVGNGKSKARTLTEYGLGIL